MSNNSNSDDIGKNNNKKNNTYTGTIAIVLVVLQVAIPAALVVSTMGMAPWWSKNSSTQ